MKQPSVYLLVESAYRDALVEHGKLPWGHTQADQLETADFVFLWLTEEPVTARAALDLGFSVYYEKPIFIAASSAEASHRAATDLGISLRLFSRMPVLSGHSIRDAYGTLLADTDIRVPDAHLVVRTSEDGVCSACGSSYKKGDSVRFSHLYGALHIDCYARRKNPSTVDAAIFHAELVKALREDNARLEARLREVTASAPL